MLRWGARGGEGGVWGCGHRGCSSTPGANPLDLHLGSCSKDQFPASGVVPGCDVGGERGGGGGVVKFQQTLRGHILW